MRVLWKRGSATVRELVEALNDGRGQKLAYTTVPTFASRLRRRGLLVRDAEGRGYRYRPATTRDGLLADLSDELIDRLFDPAARLPPVWRRSRLTLSAAGSAALAAIAAFPARLDLGATAARRGSRCGNRSRQETAGTSLHAAAARATERDLAAVVASVARQRDALAWGAARPPGRRQLLGDGAGSERRHRRDRAP